MFEKIIINDHEYIQNFLKSHDDLCEEKYLEDYKKSLTDKLNIWIDEFIEKTKESDFEINTVELVNQFFPVIKSDIFLSHSHTDEKQIIKLACYLQKQKGLDVFIDSIYWGHVGEIKKKLDDQFSRKDQQTYYYNNVHHHAQNLYLILAQSLSKMIDSTELFIFYQTNNSLPISSQTQKITRSPWVMHELQTVSTIRKNVSVYDWANKMGEPSITMEDFTAQSYKPPKAPNFLHAVDINDLIEISGKKFMKIASSSNRMPILGNILDENDIKEKWFKSLYEYCQEQKKHKLYEDYNNNF